jgi:hypothetical protein
MGLFQEVCKNMPLVGQSYGFFITAMNMTNATSPINAATIAVKGIVLDCSPPVIKYPLKCAMLGGHIALAFASGGSAFSLAMLVGQARTILMS